LFVPEWSKPAFGVYQTRSGLYTMCSDPLVIIYNKKLLSAQPNNIATIAALVESNPSFYTRQIITHGIDQDAMGLDANWFWINRRGEAGWDAT
jgi:iron(III) transport system substrate-binding protein